MISFVETFKNEEYVSHFINNFNDIDKQSRHLEKYTNYVQKFTLLEKIYLVRIVFLLNFILYPYKKFYNIKWKFAKSTNGIENNYPHTHKDIIVLPYNFINKRNMIKTILHEKIHIFQRYNPIDTLRLYMDFWDLSIIDYGLKRDQRSNPDINPFHFSYYDPVLDKMIINYIKYNKNARSIKDVSITNIESKDILNKSIVYHDILGYDHIQTEHPNEVMACLLADIILNDGKNIATQKWLKLFI